MKNYIALSLVIIFLILGGIRSNPIAFAEEDSANPITEAHDPNKIIQKEKSGEIVPEKIDPPMDECAEVSNKDKLNGANNSKTHCIKKDKKIRPKNY